MKNKKQLKKRLRNTISKNPDKSEVNNETRIDGHESHGLNNSNDKSNILNLIIPPEEQYQPSSEFWEDVDMENIFGVCPETYRISDARGMDDDVVEELVDLVMQRWSNPVGIAIPISLPKENYGCY